MKNLERISFILNIQIKRNVEKSLILNQNVYIRKFLHEYEMENVHPIATFIDGNHALISIETNEFRINQKKYQRRIDNFMYAMIGIRSDIAYVVNKLSQYCQNPAVRHRTAFDRVLRYMRKTINLTLTYDETVNLTCYADAVYGNDLIDRKSTYGHVLLIGNGTVT